MVGPLRHSARGLYLTPAECIQKKWGCSTGLLISAGASNSICISIEPGPRRSSRARSRMRLRLSEGAKAQWDPGPASISKKVGDQAVSAESHRAGGRTLARIQAA